MIWRGRFLLSHSLLFQRIILSALGPLVTQVHSGSSDLCLDFWRQKFRRDPKSVWGEARALSGGFFIQTEKVLRVRTLLQPILFLERREQGHSQSPRSPGWFYTLLLLSLQIPIPLNKPPGKDVRFFSRSIWAHHELPMARASIRLSLETVSGVFMKWALKSPVSQSTMGLKIGEVLFQDNFVFKQQDQQKMPSGNWWSYIRI